MKRTNLLRVKYIITSFFFLLALTNLLNAQTSLALEVSIPIPDHPVYNDDRVEGNDHDPKSPYEPLTLLIPANGMPERIDSSFGFEKISISVKHNRISDIKIELISPDGTGVWISNRNGKNGQDYRNATFSQRGFDGPITSAEPPFSGEYQPDGNLASYNNGQNPNGNWILKIHDLAADSAGTFEKVVLTFSDHPAKLRTSPCSITNP